MATTVRRALFIGRFQPFHEGHQWLIDQKVKKGIPVLVAVMDLPDDEDNPYPTWEVMAKIRGHYVNDDVQVIPIPPIESVNFGRTPGYQVQQHHPPHDIFEISATKIRNKLRNDGDLQ